MEDETSIPVGSLLQQLLAEDLSSLSEHELEMRGRLLKDEIARVNAMLASKKGSRSDAEAVFKNE